MDKQQKRAEKIAGRIARNAEKKAIKDGVIPDPGPTTAWWENPAREVDDAEPKT